MTYLTGCNHWGHHKIKIYCSRPFSTTEEMDKTMIDNINEIVEPKDTLIHLGDIGWFKQPEEVTKLFRQIKCQNIKLIWGNHDFRDLIRRGISILPEGKVEIWGDYKELKIEERDFVLMHYPIGSWNRQKYNSIQAHSHTHGNYKDKEQKNQYDLGVDVCDFKPVSAKTLIERSPIEPRQPEQLSPIEAF